eukprot:ANDGO_04402.mRNA.1 Myophilin
MYRNHEDAPKDAQGRPLYGLDAELHKKMQDKRDPQREADAFAWIAKVTNMEVNSIEDLKSGAILCELINAIKPGSVKKINKMKQPFFFMENIDAYVKGCAAFGVPQAELFMTIDLFEERNIPAVITNVFSLARTATAGGWSGPALGPKLAQRNSINFTEEQRRDAANTVPLLMANMNKGAKADTRDLSREVVKSPQ